MFHSARKTTQRPLLQDGPSPDEEEGLSAKIAAEMDENKNEMSGLRASKGEESFIERATNYGTVKSSTRVAAKSEHEVSCLPATSLELAQSSTRSTERTNNVGVGIENGQFRWSSSSFKTAVSSISSEEITTDNTEMEFWVREHERPKNMRYHAVPHFEKEKEKHIHWWQRNSAMAVEWLCLIALLVIGVAILLVEWIWNHESLTSTLTWRHLVAFIFFNASVISFYTFAMKIVCRRCRQKQDDRKLPTLQNQLKQAVVSLKRTTLREHLERAMGPEIRDHLKQAVPFVAYFVLGAIISGDIVKQPLCWGKALVAAGLVELSARVLFFVPRPAVRIRTLEKDLAEVKNSVAISLADAYFFNFLEWVLKDIKANDPVQVKYVDKRGEPLEKDEHDIIPKTTYPDKEQHTPFFYVVVPRRVDWGEEKPIRNLIDKILDTSGVANCQIESMSTDQGNRRNKRKFRPQTIMVDKDSDSTKRTLFDVPTTLSVVTRTIRENTKLSNKKRDDEYWREINRFTWRLQWRLHNAISENIVCIVEAENEPGNDGQFGFMTLFRQFVEDGSSPSSAMASSTSNSSCTSSAA